MKLKNLISKKIREQNLFDTPSQLFEPKDKADADKDAAPKLKDKKIVADVVSAINFAIGKLYMAELRVGTKINDSNELLRVIRHAYQIPPVQEMPRTVTRLNLEKWLNGHDPTIDNIPLKRMQGSAQIIVIDSKEIDKMKKEKPKI